MSTSDDWRQRLETTSYAVILLRQGHLYNAIQYARRTHYSLWAPRLDELLEEKKIREELLERTGISWDKVLKAVSPMEGVNDKRLVARLYLLRKGIFEAWACGEILDEGRILIEFGLN